MTETKHPWTSWALVGVSAVMVVTAIVLWLGGVSYPKSGWYVLVVWVPIFVLWWLDGIKRSNADIDYRNHLVKSEVRRAVRVELDKRERQKSKDPLAHRRTVVDTEAEETEHPPLMMVSTDPRRRKRL